MTEITEKDAKNIIDWWAGRKKADKPVKIYYTADAYVKTNALVQYHNEEVGWNMIIKPYKDGYQVSDILVYPQKVSPAYISVDTAKYGMWKAELTDEQDANLFGHGHSHVNMSTGASAVDVRQQYEEIALKHGGFWLFQIWNKQGSINSFFYDLENDLVYEDNFVEICVEVNGEDLMEFAQDSFNKLDYEAAEITDPNEIPDIDDLESV